MQRLWYYFLRFYVRFGLYFYFKKIIIHGQSNIPEGPVIFAANHQNAFMDALLIVCFNSHVTHFLARADIFKNSFARWIFGTLNMIPIYRIRDGRQALSQNTKTFDACFDFLVKNDAVVIFPEGNHGSQRRIRPVSKGFTRIVSESLIRNPELKISIIPVGLNYSSHQEFRSSVSIYFGKPIITAGCPFDANKLRIELDAQLKKLTTHIEDAEHYDQIYQKLIMSNVDFLDPENSNEGIRQIERGEKLREHTSPKKNSTVRELMRFASILINFLPLLVWKKIKSGIKDPVFTTSLRFGIGIFVFPIFYLLVGVVSYFFIEKITGLIWLAISFPSMLFYKNN